MVTLCPIPSMVKLPGEVFATAGREPLSVIVPLTLKLIVSVPVPIAQSLPVVSTPGLLALLIASRRVQNPLPKTLAGSVVLFTIIAPGVGVGVAEGAGVGVGSGVGVKMTVGTGVGVNVGIGVGVGIAV